MSYWGNTYMPTIDAIAIEAARKYVAEVGEDRGHEWRYDRDCIGTDEQAFRYLMCCIEEASEDFADDPGFYDSNYERCIFDALATGMTVLMECDWFPMECVSDIWDVAFAA